ncbi:mucin-2-like [Clytia hemisphaerica]|uniref:mucin-2-like n=1 Tax=Clytia hemisphaerica TaxID=252671 RepID=UPI0034D55CFC
MCKMIGKAVFALALLYTLHGILANSKPNQNPLISKHEAHMFIKSRQRRSTLSIVHECCEEKSCDYHERDESADSSSWGDVIDALCDATEKDPSRCTCKHRGRYHYCGSLYHRRCRRRACRCTGTLSKDLWSVIKVDYDTAKGTVVRTQTKHVPTITINNCDSEIPSEPTTRSIKESVTFTESFSQRSSVSLESGVKYTTGVPDVASGEISSTLTNNEERTTGKDKSVTDEITDTFSCRANAETFVTCNVYLNKTVVTIPYTMTLSHKRFGCRCHVSGVYRRVDYGFHLDKKVEDCSNCTFYGNCTFGNTTTESPVTTPILSSSTSITSTQSLTVNTETLEPILTASSIPCSAHISTVTVHTCPSTTMIVPSSSKHVPSNTVSPSTSILPTMATNQTTTTEKPSTTPPNRTTTTAPTPPNPTTTTAPPNPTTTTTPSSPTTTTNPPNPTTTTNPPNPTTTTNPPTTTTNPPKPTTNPPNPTATAAPPNPTTTTTPLNPTTTTTLSNPRTTTNPPNPTTTTNPPNPTTTTNPPNPTTTTNPPNPTTTTNPPNPTTTKNPPNPTTTNLSKTTTATNPPTTSANLPTTTTDIETTDEGVLSGQSKK